VAAPLVRAVDDVETVSQPEIKKFRQEEQNGEEEVVHDRYRKLFILANDVEPKLKENKAEESESQ
jgi:hypothetical protein